ncbi:DHHA1 domain-containing protein, partial [Acinetobacter nosocomialis]|uniref:DHHA1 domain-containing protein n=1 Tax=Acinetobacter nosocomialis TaxID=106654 RepID=UPI001D189033
DVLEQDRIILENLAPNARAREFLYQHDVGLARLRRLMKKEAELGGKGGGKPDLAQGGAPLNEKFGQVIAALPAWLEQK